MVTSSRKHPGVAVTITKKATFVAKPRIGPSWIDLDRYQLDLSDPNESSSLKVPDNKRLAPLL
jgi:hypothetical protein